MNDNLPTSEIFYVNTNGKQRINFEFLSLIFIPLRVFENKVVRRIFGTKTKLQENGESYTMT